MEVKFVFVVNHNDALIDYPKERVPSSLDRETTPKDLRKGRLQTDTGSKVKVYQ